MTKDPWQQRLTDLIAGNHSSTGDPVDAGAQLVVHHPDGSEAFRAALARHHRFDARNARLLWIRPLVGGHPTPEGYLFNLMQARRHSLEWESAEIEGNAVVLRLVTGQTARIEPAEDERLAELQRWDHFTDRLTAAEEEQLKALDADSWHGRFG